MAQIGYVCLGSNDFDRACAFYDAFTAELGGKRLFPTPHGQMYRLGSGAMIMVTRPYNEEASHPGNGTMMAINVDAQEDVARVYDKAISLGATCCRNLVTLWRLQCANTPPPQWTFPTGSLVMLACCAAFRASGRSSRWRACRFRVRRAPP